MLKSESINEKVAKRIDFHLENNVTDKGDIYTLVVNELGVARPTVRRVARDLKKSYERKIILLQNVNKKGKRVLSPEQRLKGIKFIIEQVENRCMAIDGPVTATKNEITDEELRKIFRLANDVEITEDD